MVDLHTPRLDLRPLCRDDESDLATLMTPGVSRWLTNFGDDFDEDQASARNRDEPCLHMAG